MVVAVQRFNREGNRSPLSGEVSCFGRERHARRGWGREEVAQIGAGHPRAGEGWSVCGTGTNACAVDAGDPRRTRVDGLKDALIEWDGVVCLVVEPVVGDLSLRIDHRADVQAGGRTLAARGVGWKKDLLRDLCVRHCAVGLFVLRS